MADGLLDFGDSEDDKKNNLGLLGLMAGLGIMGANKPGASMGQAVGQGGLAGVQGFAQQQKLQQAAQQQKAMMEYRNAMLTKDSMPTSVKEFQFAQKNGFEGTFEDYRRSSMAENRPAAPIQNFERRQQLVKEHGQDSQEVRTFDNYVRQIPYLNTGPSFVQTQMGVPGGIAGVIPKGLNPGEQPSVRGDQALATGLGTGEATRQNTIQTKGQGATGTLSLLDGAEDLIDQSTGSAIGAVRDKALGLVGKSTPGGEAIAKLKVVQSGLMMNQPRMEGPQSDKDVALYEKAAGQIGDPSVPAEIRKAAVATIKELNQKYENRAKLNAGAVSKRGAPASNDDPLGLR